MFSNSKKRSASPRWGFIWSTVSAPLTVPSAKHIAQSGSLANRRRLILSQALRLYQLRQGFRPWRFASCRLSRSRLDTTLPWLSAAMTPSRKAIVVIQPLVRNENSAAGTSTRNVQTLSVGHIVIFEHVVVIFEHVVGETRFKTIHNTTRFRLLIGLHGRLLSDTGPE